MLGPEAGSPASRLLLSDQKCHGAVAHITKSCIDSFYQFKLAEIITVVGKVDVIKFSVRLVTICPGASMKLTQILYCGPWLLQWECHPVAKRFVFLVCYAQIQVVFCENGNYFEWWESV